MKVWVVVAGCHEDRYVYGVYSTLEKAKAAYSPANARVDVESFFGHSDRDEAYWEQDEDGWSMAFGCAEIRERMVDDQ